MKEISEINKKINAGQSGAGTAVAAATRPAAPRPIPPGTMSAGGGLGFVNELAPHLQRK